MNHADKMECIFKEVDHKRGYIVVVFYTLLCYLDVSDSLSFEKVWSLSLKNTLQCISVNHLLSSKPIRHFPQLSFNNVSLIGFKKIICFRYMQEA